METLRLVGSASGGGASSPALIQPGPRARAGGDQPRVGVDSGALDWKVQRDFRDSGGSLVV